MDKAVRGPIAGRIANIPQFPTRMCAPPHHIGVTVYGHFLMRYFLADGLVMVDKYSGLYVSLTSSPLIFTCRGYVKDYVYTASVDDIAALSARINERL